MSPAADLSIRARWDGQRVSEVTTVNLRPQGAPLLRGLTAAEACERVPRLFSLCSAAQGTAAVLACTAAGVGAHAPGGSACAAQLRAEMVREHLWRLLLDWPAALGRPARREVFADSYRRVRTAGAAGPGATWPAEVSAWLEREWPAGVADELAAGERHAATDTGAADTLLGVFTALIEEDRPTTGTDMQWLPQQHATEWARAFGSVPPPAFCMQPCLGGAGRETGALARQARAPAVAALLGRGQRVAARYRARVLDLQECLQSLADPSADGTALCDAAVLPDGGGIARVETARGTLLHAVRLEHGRIDDYAIVAPTEWNLHPDGPLVRETRGHAFTGLRAAQRHLERLALALDPCVAFEVSLDDVNTRY
ncbi:MAG: nickel-dependent hydrogenase large subunit [Steroidobacteraceae bacterium]|nr:nickel-dependent hydrogenase large subunit [Steroidobacteraceae bacterium]